MQLRAEFKGNPKIFEVSLGSFSKKETAQSVDDTVDLTDDQNYHYRTLFWNNAKKIYKDLVKGKK